MQRPPAGGDQTPRQTDARCPNAPTFTGRDCHLQSSRNVVTLIRRAHAASAVPLHPSVTRIPHCAPSSTPRSLPFDRFVAAYNSYHCLPPFQVLTLVHRGCGSVHSEQRSTTKKTRESLQIKNKKGNERRAAAFCRVWGRPPFSARTALCSLLIEGR